MRITTFAITLAAAAAPLAAQQPQVSGYGEYQRTSKSHQNAWGAGAQYQLSFGGESAPVKFNPSVGVDYLKQETGGQSSYSASLDGTLQFAAGPSLSPYLGGSVSSNWSSGAGSSSGAALGLQYILGAQLKLQAQAPFALIADVRPGYVRGQEHSTTVRFGVNFSM